MDKQTPDQRAESFHIPPSRFERAKSGWLIERRKPLIQWWTGMRFDLEDDKAWTTESTKAIVFADWASAGAMLNNLQVETMKIIGSARYLERMELDVTEHAWEAPQSDGGTEHGG